MPGGVDDGVAWWPYQWSSVSAGTDGRQGRIEALVMHLAADGVHPAGCERHHSAANHVQRLSGPVTQDSLKFGHGVVNKVL